MELRTNAALAASLKNTQAWRAYDREMAVAASHAYLLLSEDEVASEQTLLMMAARAYCPTVCLQCAECRKVLDHNKPDVAEPNPTGEALSVEVAEGVVEDAAMGSFEGGKKIYIFRNMHRQSERVQNLLLKTLEEPNENVMFLLSATSTKGILPTVLSRVKTLPLPPFGEQEIVAILQQEGVATPEVFAKAGQGNLALTLALSGDESYFALVDEAVDLLATLHSSTAIPQWLYRPIFAKESIDKTLDVMEIALKDIMYVKSGIPQTVVYRNKLSVYREAAALYPARSLPMLLDLINEAKLKVASHCTAVNVADSLLLAMLEVKSLCKRS